MNSLLRHTVRAYYIDRIPTMRFQATLSKFIGGLCLGVVLTYAAAAEDAPSPVATPTKRADDPSPKNRRCTVRKDANGWWFVSPNGEKFFSLGVCMFNQGSQKGEYNPGKPSYAALSHYEAPEKWADASLGRLKAWGFTTVGGWSDYETLQQSDEHDLWITPVLHMGSTSGAPWFDMWDDNVVQRIEDVAEKNIGSLRHDPRVLGYFSDNELGWWNAALWKITLEQPATSGQRQRLLRLLHDVYDDDWTALVRDFDPDGADGWKSLEQQGMLWLRPGSDGIHTMRRFLSLVADRYYQLMRDILRRIDPRALYLGDRYQSFYYPEVPIASRPYVDVVSTNLNASWNDGTFSHSFLHTLHELTGKPILVSEFYMAAKENRSGNKNSVGGFPKVDTQEERGKAIARTLATLAQLPYVVGADWFQYYDEPPHGRQLDGEDYNFGLVDIHDQPYLEAVEAFTSIDVHKLKSTATTPKTAAAPRIPRAPEHPLANFTPIAALKSWNRIQGRIPAAAPHPTGDLYVVWSPQALYVGVWVLDIVETDYYRDGVVPDVDRAAWRIEVAGSQPVTATLGAGKTPTVTPAGIEVQATSSIYHDLRCIAAVRLPAAYLGKDRLEPGDQLSLDSSLTSHARAYTTKWKATFVLSE